MAPPPAAYEPPPPPVPREKQPGERRDSWYIGFELGGGAASYKVGNETVNWNEVFKGTDSFRMALTVLEVGGTIAPQFLLGARFTAIAESADEVDVSFRLQQTQYLVNATFFPLPSGEGLFLRAGLGASILTMTLESEFLDVSDSFRGFGASAGLGYAFWLLESFNLSLAIDTNYGSFDGKASQGEPTSGAFHTFMVGCYWY